MYKRIFVILYMLCLAGAACAQTITATKHISSADGLSNDFVTRLAIDGQGYVWVATESGANRIAGKSITPLPASEWASGMNITALCWHEKAKAMLIGTERGLNIYTPSDGQLRHLTGADGLVSSSINDIRMAYGAPKMQNIADSAVWLAYGNGMVQLLNLHTLSITNLELNHGYGIRCVMDDNHGHLYIGHNQNGMTEVSLTNLATRSFLQQKNVAGSLPGNNVRKIYQDNNGRIWVGTDNGMALFHPEWGTFTKVSDPDDHYDANVYDICQMRDGRLWVATDIGGIKVFNPHTSQPDRGLYYDDTQIELSSLNTRSIAEDEYGNVWVGCHSTGVDFISAEKPYFDLLNKGVPVYAMTIDAEGGCWMATMNGLIHWQQGAVTERWPSPDMLRRQYSSPRCLMADSRGNVWIGVDDQGIYRFNRHTEHFTPIPVSPDGSDIHSFAEDSKGCIWIGTEFGVWVYENLPTATEGRLTRHDAISNIIRAPASSIIPTAPNQLFIATLGDGIYSVNLQTMDAKHLSTRDGMPSGKINQVIQGSQQEFWMATDKGLVCLTDPITLTGISIYGKEQGLNDEHILSLQQDANGQIWMSTYSGISCFVKSTGKFYNYNHLDTQHTGGFVSGAATTIGDDTIWFGTASGICSFSPKHIGSGSQLSDVQIISCEAYNPVGSNTEIRLLTPGDDGRVYTSYQQNTIRLIFATRNFAQASTVEYSYMMKGMDNKWYDIGNDHDVVFRALRPGHYTFILRAKLRSQNYDLVKETRLGIIITPPFWKTWWAYVLYALLAVAVVTFLIRTYKHRLQLRSALELERRESQQKELQNEELLRFFTNITHELRTPLTLVLGPLDDLMEDRDLPQQSRRRVAMIQKHTERLRSLISEILEFRKTQTQNRRLTVARGDIGKFVHDICFNYKEINSNPKVYFDCQIAPELPLVWFDSEIITTVLNNLLSNAIKYTEQGSITTTVSAHDGKLDIAVADTGYGITAEALPHIFDRYYQAKGSHQASGTGIGLALVKSLVELHEGTISVESSEGKGSTFTFTLQAGNTYPNALHKEDAMPETNPGENKENTGDDSATGDNGKTEDSQPTLLIVEDNEDIRQYISDTFADYMRILQAANGEEGLLAARENMPDIIVSDIMMPKMNGIDLTKELKGDISTCHIPIILLTAKTTDDDKEEGYDSGADSYLTKPFTAKLLASRIRNLLSARRRLKEMIANGNTSEPLTNQTELPNTQSTAPQPSPLDQQFIEQLNTLIDDNIMHVEIDMAFVTARMTMSHSTFYRKVKALTGMTATEYIRKRRLRHCYHLLESGDYNVNQAAMMTGFNQMAHFRETFKKEFGILPSEVKKSK